MNEYREVALSLVLVTTMPFLVLGAPMVRTEMPLSLFADTEISTNIVFAAYEPKQRQFAYELVFDATPTNNFKTTVDGSTITLR